MTDAAATSTPDRSRSRLILWVALGLVAGLLVAAGAYFGWTSYQNAQAVARQEAFETAQAHYEKALDSLDSAQASLSGADTVLGEPHGVAYTQLATSAANDLEIANKELTAAEKAAPLIENRVARRSLTEGIKFMREASEELDGATKSLPQYGPLMDLADDVVDLSDTISDTREDTLQAINKNTWSTAAKKNKSGLAAVRIASKKLNQMEKLRVKLKSAGHGITQAQQEVRANKSQMTIQSQLIANGRAGRTSTFNALIDKYNDGIDKFDTIGMPKFYDSAKAYLGAPMMAAATAAASLDRADEKLIDAREAFLRDN